MLSLHPDTFSCIAITSDSHNLSEVIREVKQLCFERGTGQSLEPAPRPASRHGLLIFKDTPAGSTHGPHVERRLRHHTTEKAAPCRHGPLESLVAYLQSLTQLYTLAVRRALQGVLGNERGKRCPAPATPTQRKTAAPVHDLHDWNSRPLNPLGFMSSCPSHPLQKSQVLTGSPAHSTLLPLSPSAARSPCMTAAPIVSATP